MAASPTVKDFRKLVLSRMVRFWKDPRDIKLAIHETMSEYSRREDLVGWVRGSEAIDAGPLAEELARLTKENADLRKNQVLFSGLTFSQIIDTMDSECLLGAFHAAADVLMKGEVLYTANSMNRIGERHVLNGESKCRQLAAFGLITLDPTRKYWEFTESGRNLALQLKSLETEE